MFQDLRFGLRMLTKNPVYTLAVILILAFSIGANTALFTVVDAWLVRPLPFKEPERLVAIWKSELKNPRVPAVFAFQPNIRNGSNRAGRSRVWRAFIC